jgi:hypothetical protein
MADLTKTSLVRDESKEVTLNNGAASTTIDFNGQDEKMVLYVTNADVAAATITVKAGDGLRSDIGDYAVAVAQNKAFALGPFDSMRFKGSGKLTVTVTNADGSEYSGTVTNVKIAILQLP